MRLVAQLDDSGCGLACVAMISGKTYYEIREKYHKIVTKNRTNKRFYGTRAKALHKLNNKISPKMIAVKNWDTIPNFAIVAIGKRKSGNWHWVVFKRDRKGNCCFYDPGAVKIRTDLGRVNLKAYVKIN